MRLAYQVRRGVSLPKTGSLVKVRSLAAQGGSLGIPAGNRLVSVNPTTALSVMTGLAILPGHRICSWPRDKVPTIRKHRDESLVSTTQVRVGCGHASGHAACFPTVHQGGFETAEHPVWVVPLTHKMTLSPFPNIQGHTEPAGIGWAVPPRGFPGPTFGPCPDC
jgi:hypothetical protein